MGCPWYFWTVFGVETLGTVFGTVFENDEVDNGRGDEAFEPGPGEKLMVMFGRSAVGEANWKGGDTWETTGLGSEAGVVGIAGAAGTKRPRLPFGG